MKHVLILFIALVVPRALGNPELPRDLIDQANTSFTQAAAGLTSRPAEAAAEFARSAALYQKAIDALREAGESPSSPLLYNLGNASFLAGDTGRAILAYRRAERLDPANARIQSNLAKAREKIGARAPEDSSIIQQLSILEVVPPALRFWVAALAFAAAWILALCRLVPIAFTPPRILVAGAAILSAVAAASLVPRELRLRDRTAGVVTVPEVVARAGPDDATYDPKPASPLKGGTEVRIVESRGDWLLVTLPDDTQSWLPESSVTRIAPE